MADEHSTEAQRLEALWAGKFGDEYAVNKLTMRVSEGEIFGLLGPNGAGKTTTIRMLSTLIAPDEGTANVNGYDVRTHRQEVRESLGVLTTHIGLYERFSARENIEYFAHLYGMDPESARTRVDFLLDLLGARGFENQKAAGLSTGMRQKVAIARSVVHDPAIIIFDEPTLGRDVLASQTVRDFMKAESERGRTVLLSTHDMFMAQKMCERVAVIHQGALIAEGTPSGIIEKAGAGTLEEAFVALVAPRGGESR